jgi:hypothetical protein
MSLLRPMIGTSLGLIYPARSVPIKQVKSRENQRGKNQKMERRGTQLFSQSIPFDSVSIQPRANRATQQGTL